MARNTEGPPALPTHRPLAVLAGLYLLLGLAAVTGPWFFLRDLLSRRPAAEAVTRGRTWARRAPLGTAPVALPAVAEEPAPRRRP